MDAAGAPAEPKFLFSFLGRESTHPVRSDILRLDGAASPCVDVDSAPERLAGFDYSQSYRNLIVDSKFVLCPRGFGASSIRTFEVMAAGRVPVIISDRWRPTPGIPWNDFCVFVAEQEVRQIPAILASLESDSQNRGKLAREFYQQFFAPEVFFQRLLQTLTENYSDCGFTGADTVLRALRTLRWREFKTVASQIKSGLIGARAGRTVR